jgi:serine/threonine-protein kinase
MARKKAVPKPVVVRCPRCGCDADPSAGAVNFCPACGTDLRPGAGEGSTSGALVHRVIADRYRLIALVGEGGMGAVYKAEHIRMGKALALKILRGDFAREPGAVDRFLAEARIVSRLSHPHTIAVFDFGEIDAAGSGFYLAMEYVPGRDLAAELRESGPLPERRVAGIGQQILGSLAEAHDAGIVHRDVKPGNVMLMQTRSGEDFVKVLDFGIAKLRHGPEPVRPGGRGAAPAGATAADAIVGTPNYLAPEQARGGAVDARSDLYAVGCLLYELAAGRPPFVAPAPMAVVKAHLHDDPPPLASVVPGVSRRFAEVIHRALRKRPEERFASADAMRDALESASEPTGAHALRQPGAPQLTGDLRIASREDFAELDHQIRALRRGRVLAPLTALALLAAAGACAWRWGDLYALAAARAPRLAAAVPEALRPRGLLDGEEREPNDLPAAANPLRLPAGPDGRPGGGSALVRGHVGAKLSDASGDVDVYRIEVPPFEGRKVLVASWRGERADDGIRALDVALLLHREPRADPARPDAGRAAAPLVARTNRAGPGRPETLVAAVSPGVHWLTVREHHDEATGPVEKPTDRYVLEVRLADPEPGRELEPNDGAERDAPGPDRYPAWRDAASLNAPAEASPVRAETDPEDPDLFALAAPPAGEPPALALAVPDPGLALAARLWAPDGEDLAPAGRARVRLEDAGEAAPGQVLAVRLPAPRPGAPVLLQLRAAAGRGGYELVVLGGTAASGAEALARVRALADAGRPAQALEVAAAFASELPGAASRDEILLLAGTVAERAAGSLAPEGLAAYERASRLLGAAVLEAVDGKVRYRGAFEARVAPDGPRATEAAARVEALGAPAPAPAPAEPAGPAAPPASAAR